MKFLISTISGVADIVSEKTQICIVTNKLNGVERLDLEQSISAFKDLDIYIKSFEDLAHPWYLTWAHKSIMSEKFLTNEFSHYLYLEDDLKLSNTNIKYWLEHRIELKNFNLYPSFLRVEFCIASEQWVSTDIVTPLNLDESKILYSGNRDIFFVNSPQPYQGMFFYDSELMGEHLGSITARAEDYGLLEYVDSNPEWPGGGVAERANLALTYHDLPEGHSSRNVLPFDKYYLTIDQRCLIHHIPNNYANDKPESPCGKLSLGQLIPRKYLL